MNKKILAILPISIGGRLTTNSIIDGYKQNNCDVTVFDELYDSNIDELLKSNYHQIVGYDFSAIKIKVKYNLKTPTINYFSDNIRSKTSGENWEQYLTYLENESSNNNNFVFYWDKALTEQEKIKNIFYLPHFVNFDIYKNLKTKPQFDVMFAGRLDTTYRLNFFEQLLKQTPNLNIAWYAIEKHYKDALKRTKTPLLLEKCYQGFIDNENDMTKAINNAKIVFNMNAQGISSLNYRTFQTIACKRLLISDKREELSLFEGQIPIYKDVSDLIKKINYYLTNTNDYKSITEKCYEICKKNHNSKDSIKFILETIKQNENIHK